MDKHKSLSLLDYLKERECRPIPRTILRDITKDSPQIMFSIKRLHELSGHSGCVNTLAWSNDGDYLLSGSDDLHLNIHSYDGEFKLKTSTLSGHHHNIFNAKFLPCSNNSKIISCACDYSVIYTDVNFSSTYGKYKFNCHHSIPYDVVVINDEPYSFFVCAREGTVRHYDLRIKTSCNCSGCSDDVIIQSSSSIHAMDISSIRPYELVLGLGNNNIEFYDRRMISSATDLRNSSSHDGYMFQYRNVSASTPSSFSGITSMRYSDDGEELICNYVGNKVMIISCDPSNRPNNTNYHATPEYFSRTSYFDVNNTRMVKIDNICSKHTEPLRTMSLRSKGLPRRGIRANESSVTRNSTPASIERYFEPKYQETFTGHSNTKTILKEASFWGKNYVMAGSDCGKIFIWDRKTSKVCNVLDGDDSVVNVIQPHPTLPIFGCSGIDSTIKIFAPEKLTKVKNYTIQNAISNCSELIQRGQDLYQVHYISINLNDYTFLNDNPTPETTEVMSEFNTDEE